MKYAELDEEGKAASLHAFSELSTPGFFDGPMSISPDGNWLFITRNQNFQTKVNEENEQKLGIFVYKKSEAGWLLIGGHPANSGRYNVCHPHWDANNQKLYFASDMPGGFGALDLYFTEMKEENVWTNPVNLGNILNSPGNDCFPFLLHEHFLFFTSDREGGKGGFDLYASVNRNASWGNPIPLDGLNTGSDDLSLVFNETGNVLYFASSRPGGKGMDDIFTLNLGESIILSSPDYFTLKVLNKETGKPVEGVNLVFQKFIAGETEVIEGVDSRLSIIQEIETGSLANSSSYYSNTYGELNFYLPKDQYILYADKEGYGLSRQLIDFTSSQKFHTIFLDSIVCKGFKIVFEDGETGQPVLKYHIEPVYALQFIRNKEGELVYCLAKGQELLGDVTSDGYFDRDIRISYEDIVGKDVISIRLDKKIPTVVETEKLPVKKGETIVLRQIYYDYDSADLKPDAVKTLDQLVTHMKKYPTMIIELSAHTDARGRESYNLSLSEHRAQNAKLYLVSKGINTKRINAIGYGESKPLNHCIDGVQCSEKDHAINRRTEVKVLSHENGVIFRYNGQ